MVNPTIEIIDGKERRRRWGLTEKLRIVAESHEPFGALLEKLRGAIEQLELVLGELEEQMAETTPLEPDQPVAPTDDQPRRKPTRKPLPETLPRDVVEHAAPCACPKCGGSLRPLGEDVAEVLDYVPGSFRGTRHVGPKLSCRTCGGIAQAPAPSLPIYRGLAGPGLLAHVLVAKYCDHQRCIARPKSMRARDRSGSLDVDGLGRADHPFDASAGRCGRRPCHGGSPRACR